MAKKGVMPPQFSKFTKGPKSQGGAPENLETPAQVKMEKRMGFPAFTPKGEGKKKGGK